MDARFKTVRLFILQQPRDAVNSGGARSLCLRGTIQTATMPWRWSFWVALAGIVLHYALQVV